MHTMTSLKILAVTVGFSQSEYTLNEDDGGLVCVVLLGGTIQSVASVTVTLNATDGSATGELINTD